MKSHIRWIVLACVAVAGLSQGSALAQHSDIVLGMRDGQLAIVDEDPVFPGNFFRPIDVLGNTHRFTSNPGFLGVSAEELPAGYDMLPPDTGFRFFLRTFPLDGVESANLWYWDGVDDDGDGDYLDDVDFAPVSDGSAFWVYRGIIQNPFFESDPAFGDDTDEAGFDLDTTSSEGGLHDHPIFGVFGPAATPPADGVYLASLGLELDNVPGMTPAYLAIRTDVTAAAAREAARDWVSSVVAPVCPGDVDGSGTVGLADLAIVLSNFGRTGMSFADGDLNEDSNVDLTDLSLLLSLFGTGC